MMRPYRPISNANLDQHVPDLKAADCARRPVKLNGSTKNLVKISANHDSWRKGAGQAVLSTLVEILLIGVLVTGAILLIRALLHPPTNTSAAKPPSKSSPVFRLTRTVDDQLWAQVGFDEIVSVDLLNHNSQTVFRTKGSSIVRSRISRDGTTYMVSLDNREIGIFKNRELLVSHQVPTLAAPELSLSANGETAILASEGTKIRCWDLSDAIPTWTDYEVPQPFSRIALTPDGTMFVMSNQHGQIDLYEAKTGNRLKSLTEIEPIKSDFAFSDDGNWLTFAGSETFNLYDMHSLKTAWQIPLDPPDDQPLVAISPNGRMVAVGNSRVGIQIVNGSTGETVRRFNPDKTPRSLEFSKSGDALYMTSMGDGRIRCWSLATGRELKPIELF